MPPPHLCAAGCSSKPAARASLFQTASASSVLSSARAWRLVPVLGKQTGAPLSAPDASPCSSAAAIPAMSSPPAAAPVRSRPPPRPLVLPCSHKHHFQRGVWGFFFIGNASHSEMYFKKKKSIFFWEKVQMTLLSAFLRHLLMFFTNSAVISPAPKCRVLIRKKALLLLLLRLVSLHVSKCYTESFFSG